MIQRPRAIGLGLGTISIVLAFAATSAEASSTSFERAWGKDVVIGGGTGFEVCTVAANCQAGSIGALGAELRDPEAIAVSAAGNVYVGDSNERISVFDPSGNFIRAWGRDVVAGGGTGPEICTVASSCHYGDSGGLGGEFRSPQSLAIAGGFLYVADGGNQRIDKFDLDGNFISAWGRDVVSGGTTAFEVCTVAVNCKQGVQGSGNGDLRNTNGVAASASSVYVADTDNHRISKYDSSGTFLGAWGKDVSTSVGSGPEFCALNCQAGSAGGAGGEFNFPLGVAVGPGDTVYVADTSNNRVQQTDALGGFTRAWGGDVVTGAPTGFEVCTVAVNCKAGVAGGLGGELTSPTAVAVDGAGDVYATELNSQRLQQFGPSGSFVQIWGRDVVTGGTAGAEVCTVAASCKVGVAGGLGGSSSTRSRSRSIRPGPPTSPTARTSESRGSVPPSPRRPPPAPTTRSRSAS